MPLVQSLLPWRQEIEKVLYTVTGLGVSLKKSQHTVIRDIGIEAGKTKSLGKVIPNLVLTKKDPLWGTSAPIWISLLRVSHFTISLLLGGNPIPSLRKTYPLYRHRHSLFFLFSIKENCFLDFIWMSMDMSLFPSSQGADNKGSNPSGPCSPRLVDVGLFSHDPPI